MPSLLLTGLPLDAYSAQVLRLAVLKYELDIELQDLDHTQATVKHTTLPPQELEQFFFDHDLQVNVSFLDECTRGK